MRVLVIQASPNVDGLTAACARAAAEGIEAGGGTVDAARLNDLAIGRCAACNNGWGTCRTEHYCQVEDGFQALHARLQAADALVLVTPVYWGDMSESTKAFTDRVRRCEASLGENSRLAGKRVLLVAAAGGGGGGAITCLLNMERWVQHVRARVFDAMPVSRWSRPHKLDAIRAAARLMVTME